MARETPLSVEQELLYIVQSKMVGIGSCESSGAFFMQQ
jgi:hypothetical protein